MSAVAHPNQKYPNSCYKNVNVPGGLMVKVPSVSGSPPGMRSKQLWHLLVLIGRANVAVVFLGFGVLVAYLASGATLEIPLPIAYSSRNLGHAAHGPSQQEEEGKEGRSGHSNCNYFICVKTSVVGR